VVEFMRDPLDLCVQPAFAVTPYITVHDGCDVGHRFVDWNCRLVMYERVHDRCDQLGALALPGAFQNEGHVEETARLVQVLTTIGVCFCCIASALVGNVDSSCGGSAGESEPCAHPQRPWRGHPRSGTRAQRQRAAQEPGSCGPTRNAPTQSNILLRTGVRRRRSGAGYGWTVGSGPSRVATATSARAAGPWQLGDGTLELHVACLPCPVGRFCPGRA
jgi:hypothetical protein